MFKFFRHISSAPIDASESRPVPHSMPAPTSTSVRPHADIQRELVRVVLKDTLRRHGIPFDWLACEVVTITHSPSAQELHIQLMLLQWHELFLRYAPALEYQLLRGLDRFEPSVDHSKYSISWRFSPDCGCPFSVMPPPLVWSHEVAPAPAAAEPASVLDRRQLKRAPKADAAAKPAAASAVQPTPPRDGDPGDYERTELSPFR
jgi:hypothetical protein